MVMVDRGRIWTALQTSIIGQQDFLLQGLMPLLYEDVLDISVYWTVEIGNNKSSSYSGLYARLAQSPHAMVCSTHCSNYDFIINYVTRQGSLQDRYGVELNGLHLKNNEAQ